MNDSLISQFIDNEMDLDEKIEFVETVHTSQQFSTETVALLEQEKLLRACPAAAPVMPGFPGESSFSLLELLRSWWQPIPAIPVLVAVTFLAVMGWQLVPHQPVPVGSQGRGEYRFVLYLPKVSHAEIIGTFTDWSPVPMRKVGTTGYWALTLKIPPGEYRYSYLIEDGEKMADPSVAVRESDDFGGENSVIVIGGGDDPVS